MADLISREALLAAFEAAEEDDIELYGVHISDCFPSERAAEIANKLPAVDAEEVVRCAECKHSSLMPGTTDLYLCGKLYTGIRAKDFCSYGELQTNCGADMRGNPNDS